MKKNVVVASKTAKKKKKRKKERKISIVSSCFLGHKNLYLGIKKKELLTDTIILKSLKSIMLRKKEPYRKATYCSGSFMIF